MDEDADADDDEYLSILSHPLKRRLQSRRRQMEGHLEKAPVFGQCAHHRSNRRWCVWDVRTPALYEALVCLGCAHTSAITSAGVGSAGGVCVFSERDSDAVGLRSGTSLVSSKNILRCCPWEDRDIAMEWAEGGAEGVEVHGRGAECCQPALGQWRVP